MEGIQEGLGKFESHYGERLEKVEYETIDNQDGIKKQYILNSPLLKQGNGPTIFSHGEKTEDVLVITHGLSDSPYYVKAIARRFYAEGVNVIMPLLPAHGLIDPDKAMEDYKMDAKWKEELDHAVEVAAFFGDRVSLGGFSTGGALSLNKILRNPKQIGGGLFLFSGALDLGLIDELSRFKFLQSIVKVVDGKIPGIGRDPYKYPKLPKFGGFELGQIIKDNDKRIKGKKISHPVFAAHSAHDGTINVHCIVDFLEKYVEKGFAFIISDNVAHSEVVLDKDISLDVSQKDGPAEPPKANPDFDWMMDNVLYFFKDSISNC